MQKPRQFLSNDELNCGKGATGHCGRATGLWDLDVIIVRETEREREGLLEDDLHLEDKTH